MDYPLYLNVDHEGLKNNLNAYSIRLWVGSLEVDSSYARTVMGRLGRGACQVDGCKRHVEDGAGLEDLPLQLLVI